MSERKRVSAAELFAGALSDVMYGPGAYLDGYLNGLRRARHLAPAALEREIATTMREITRDDEQRDRMSRP